MRFNVRTSTDGVATFMITAFIDNTDPDSVHQAVLMICASSIINTPTVTVVRVR